MTDRELRIAIQALGLNVRKIDGEYRVSRTGDDEALAYYTDDRADALDTARHMANAKALEQSYHFYASTAIAWAVALTRREAIASALLHSKGVFKTDDNGGVYVYSVRVGVPKSATYNIDQYQPQGVPLTERVHGSFKLLAKKRVVHLMPIED